MTRKIMLAVTGLLVGFLASASANAAVINNASFPFSMTVFVPCADGGLGEVVELTGRLHHTFNVSQSSDGLFHLEVHDNPQSVSGIGQTSGDRYHATGMTRFQIVSGAPLDFTYVDNFLIIGQGRGNNFEVHENLHIRMDGDGKVTAFHDNFRTTCK